MVTMNQPNEIVSRLETPCLLLDENRLRRNADTMLGRAAHLNVQLRPHLKTSKSVQVAHIAKAGEMNGITVSTLKEAEYFAAAGYRDILLAVAISANKLDRLSALSRRIDEPVRIVTDSVAMAHEIAQYASAQAIDISVLIEIDCGEHRCGLSSDDPAVIQIGNILTACSHTTCAGVMTHAGHSYSTSNRAEIVAIAESERVAAVDASQRLRAAGLSCEIVSVGSSPTAMFAERLDGVTEMRCGIYLFWDLAQLSRGVCSIDDIAMTVLASVISHNRAAGTIVLDAGALALSKDVGAKDFLPDARYGYVCDATTMRRLGDLSVDQLHQEHGSVFINDEKWYDALPISTMVRIIPNHACITAAPYRCYNITRGDRVLDRWERIGGW